MSPLFLDGLFAYGHFIGIGVLITFLAMETALTRDDMTPDRILRLARIDAGVGVGAMLILAAGLARVFYGLKGADFYLGNPAFLTKMGFFLLAGLASIPPTIQFLKWRKSLAADPAFRPEPKKIRVVRGHLMAEWACLALIALAAVLITR